MSFDIAKTGMYEKEIIVVVIALLFLIIVWVDLRPRHRKRYKPRFSRSKPKYTTPPTYQLDECVELAPIVADICPTTPLIPVNNVVPSLYKPICVLYGQNFGSVERNYLMPRLTEIIFKEILLLDLGSTTIHTLQILTTNLNDPTIRALNLANLERMRTVHGVSVFVSALGSSIVSYLADLFFAIHPLDTFHVNAFSTTVALSTQPNLLRLFPVDTVNRLVFVQQTVSEGSTAVFIVHDSGTWSSGMNDALLQAFPEVAPTITVTSVPIEVNVLSDAEIVAATNALAGTFTESSTMIFVIDSNKAELIMQTLQSNAGVPASLKILLGDASISYTKTPAMVSFFNLHNTRIILPFPGFDRATSLFLQARLDASLIANPVPPPSNAPNATTKISSLGNYTVTALDLAFYIAQLPPSLRLARKRYIDLSLTATLDLLNVLYGIDLFTLVDDPSHSVLAIAFVFDDTLYVTPITS